MMYHAHGLLLPESDFTLAAAARKLGEAFPHLRQTQSGDRLSLANDEWEIHLTLEHGPEVLEDSRRVADHVGGAEDELGIRRCDRRVDVATDMADPEMEHFNDYLKVIETLQSFKGVIPIDPKEPSLL
jgi:hypothetical protein